MRIKTKPTFNNRYLAECARMEREKTLEIEQSKRLYEMRRAAGCKRGEGQVGAKSRHAVLNAIATEGKEVMTEAGQGFWDDMQRRYHWQAEDGNWQDGNSPNGRVTHLGIVSEKFMRGKWWHWDKVEGCWVEGALKKGRGFNR